MRVVKILFALFSWLLVFLGVSIILWLLIIPWYRANRAVYGMGLVVPESKPPLVPTFPFASLWESSSSSSSQKLADFFLTIDKLGIKNARVTAEVDPSDRESALPLLKRSTIHLKGSASPGQWGNVIILGHSSLPFLFDENNYQTIFSSLPELSKEDIVELRFAGEDFYYKVEEKRLVGSQKDLKSVPVGPGRKLTLVTCFPPGLTSKRLLVIAKLHSFNEAYFSLEENRFR